METYKDYIFLLEPSDAVKRQIANYKEVAVKHIGNYTGMKGTAHISIYNMLRQKPHIIDTFLQTVENKLTAMPPITLDIEGFNFFMHGKELATIYAVIKPTYKSDNWFALLKRELKGKTGFTPHITIAKAIPIDNFYTLWGHFRLLRYQESFVVDKLTVIGKETLIPKASYEIYKKIYFQNQLNQPGHHVTETELKDNLNHQ